MGLSPAQVDALQGLVRGAPDALLHRLETALGRASAADAAMTGVHRIAEDEAAGRRVRDMVLEPLRPLAFPPVREAGPNGRALIGRGDFIAIWPLMGRAAAGLRNDVMRLGRRPYDDPPVAAFDALCTATAEALSADPGMEPRLADPARVADLLALAPILRRARGQLPAWVRTLSGARLAAVRLAFKDAAALAPEGGPMLIEALYAWLEEPNRILRLISAVMDRPSDRYLAASELADFGARLLDDVDLRIRTVRDFDPYRGAEGGAAAASAVGGASDTLLEFDQWLALSPDGPWGARVAAQKRNLALAVEARLREVEKAVALALPTHAQRHAGSLRFGAAPRLTDLPDPGAVRKAEGLLALLDETRQSAGLAGFGALRARVIEALEKRLDPYVEDLVDALRTADGEDAPDPDYVRAYLDVAADLYGLVKGPQAAQIVRRRAAAA